jgi:hypothetical protein
MHIYMFAAHVVLSFLVHNTNPFSRHGSAV